ncbi:MULTISPECIES: helix-turn-helix domain-containing protein [Halomonas]|uniref:helix-turn-helix domain-containing protein n=1 Tax=Halomonas TaxID=2745 RepID=UPI003CF00916
MTTLGNLIREHRLEKGFNKAELARQIGVSDVSVSYYESGAIKQIGHERLGRLVQVLDISLYDVLGIDEREHFQLSAQEEESKRQLLLKLQQRVEEEESAMLSPAEVRLLAKSTSLKESLATIKR